MILASIGLKDMLIAGKRKDKLWTYETYIQGRLIATLQKPSILWYFLSAIVYQQYRDLKVVLGQKALISPGGRQISLMDGESGKHWVGEWTIDQLSSVVSLLLEPDNLDGDLRTESRIQIEEAFATVPEELRLV